MLANTCNHHDYSMLAITFHLSCSKPIILLFKLIPIRSACIVSNADCTKTSRIIVFMFLLSNDSNGIKINFHHTHHNDKPEPLNRHHCNQRHHNHPVSHLCYPMWFNAYYSRRIANNERIFNMFSCLRGSSSCRNTASNRHDSWTWWNAIRRVAICAGYKIML